MEKRYCRISSTTALLLFWGSTIAGCATDERTAIHKNAFASKTACGDLRSDGTSLYLSSVCKEVRAITIEWSFSGGAKPERVTYRIGDFVTDHRREVEPKGTVGRIIADTPAPTSGEVNAISDVRLLTNEWMPGKHILWINNTGNRYVFVGVKMIGPEYPYPINAVPTQTLVLPPHSERPNGISIMDSGDKPGRHLLIFAEYEPK